MKIQEFPCPHFFFSPIVHTIQHVALVSQCGQQLGRGRAVPKRIDLPADGGGRNARGGQAAAPEREAVEDPARGREALVVGDPSAADDIKLPLAHEEAHEPRPARTGTVRHGPHRRT